MRKFLTAGAAGLLMSAGLMFGTGLAAHAGSDACTDPTQSGQTASGVQICTPAGSISAAGDQSTASGYVEASGNPSNGNPGGGWIAVEGNGQGGEQLAIVGCGDPASSYQTSDNEASGETEPPGSADGAGHDGNDNNVIVSSDGTGIPPTAPSGDCAPSAP
jgi:hypothetical protein